MLSVFSHRFHRFTQKLGCLQGAHLCNLWELLCCCGGRIPPLLSSAPNESVLICAICGRLSSAAGSVNSVQSVGGLLFAECILPQISQIYTEVRLSSRGCHLCNLWKSLCSCGGRIPPLLSSAPNESVLICVICGRFSSAAGSVNSVQSVGGPLFAWLVQQRLLHPLKMHPCNLWEALLSSRFCEFRAICGRTAACSVGALETSAPPKNASVPSVGGSPQQQVL